MFKNQPRKGGRPTRGGRVGRFHFAPSGPRQYRLMALLMDRDPVQIRIGPSIGDLWRLPLSIDPAIESEVIGIRVEHRPDTEIKGDWRPLFNLETRRRESDEG